MGGRWDGGLGLPGAAQDARAEVGKSPDPPIGGVVRSSGADYNIPRALHKCHCFVARAVKGRGGALAQTLRLCDGPRCVPPAPGLAYPPTGPRARGTPSGARKGINDLWHRGKGSR